MTKNKYANLLVILAASLLLCIAFGTAAKAAEIPEGTPPEPIEAVEKETPEVDPASLPSKIILRDYLVISQVGTYGRKPLHVDRLESQLVQGSWQTPKAGDTITSPQGSIHRWDPALADKDGTLTHDDLRGGYALAKIDSPIERVMLLEPQGNGTCWVNGDPRPGDPYFTGQLLLPVQLNKGENQFLFHVGSGELSARLVAPQQSQFIDLRDNTLPDLVAGTEGTFYGSVLVVNAGVETLRGIYLETELTDQETQKADATSMIPLTARKLTFKLIGKIPTDREKVEIELRLMQAHGSAAKQLDAVKLALDIKQPDELYRRTFISEIDGSVQMYAVQPAKPGSKSNPALIVSLHAAAENAVDQAELYSPKDWAQVIAPTNRRSYGFDWEDWGRIDALEAISDAEAHFQTDSRRVLLSGFSMGGHGAWHLGVNYPGRFAAIAPNAGWVSFKAYGGLARTDTSTDLENMLTRATGISDTVKLVKNLSPTAVSIIQGEADQIVPVDQARMMRKELATFHPNFSYHEKPGGDHTWSQDQLDSPLLQEFMKAQTSAKPDEVTQINFITANPGVSSKMHWLTIEAQEEQFQPSEVTIHYDSNQRKFLGSTKNVERFTLDVAHLEPRQAVSLVIDGEKIGPVSWPSGSPKIWLEKDEKRWRNSTQAPYLQKGPHRYGLFKDALRNRVLFVYGTEGTPAENAWSLAKAKFDAETFAYRGSASIEVIADEDFDMDKEPNRNVILYGNADTNGAWPALLSTSPVQVRRNQLNIGSRPELGDNIACIFIRPRPGSNTASVGVVTGTGLSGMKATNRLRYFVSGIAYPDIMVYSADVFSKGENELRMVGYFGLNWSIDEGEFAWRDLAL